MNIRGGHSEVRYGSSDRSTVVMWKTKLFKISFQQQTKISVLPSVAKRWQQE